MGKHTGLKIMAAGAAMIVMINIFGVLTVSTTMNTVVTAAYQAVSDDKSKSSNAKQAGCEQSSTDPVDPTETDTITKIATMFANKGYSKAATAGMLGNLYGESGLNPLAESHDGGYGIAQWTPRSKIRDWLDANGHSDMSDSDLNAQSLMLTETVGGGFNTYYVSAVEAEGYTVPGGSLYRMWTEAADAKTAAIAFMAGYERPNWSLRNEDTRVNMAEQYYSALGSVTFKTADGTASDSTGTSGSTTITTSCSTSSNAEYGSVGGAPTDRKDFGWMCDWGGICENGDGLDGEGSTRNFYHANVGRYQCVWYAWNRLAMIHGSEGWSPVRGNGGAIHLNVVGQPGWEVSDTPKPGDGISQYGGGLKGDSTYGHVAVVEKVEQSGSGWKIMISEGNFVAGGNGPWQGYGTRWLDSSAFQGAGAIFFRNTNWKN